MTADRPRLWDNSVALAAVAAHLHAQRVALYPAAIESGKLSAADAASGIRIMAAIALDWRRKLDLCPPVLDPQDDDYYGWFAHQPVPEPVEATNAEKIETLERATARAAQLHDRKPARERDDYAACVAALLWWQQPYDYGAGTGRSTTSRLEHIHWFNVRIREEYSDRWRTLGWRQPDVAAGPAKVGQA